MKNYTFLDEKGTFELNNPELTSYLYFPIANEYGVMSSVTPTLGGDNKRGQNSFLLAPVSSEDLHNNRSARNFWCNIKGKGIWSATGNSAEQQMQLFSDQKENTVLKAGLMWQEVTRISDKYGITSKITSFVPSTDSPVELMVVTLSNHSEVSVEFTPTAAIPIYGRSADNIRDHRHVTSLLHRIETRKTGVVVNPTLTFDERGHHKNTVIYGVFGGTSEGELPVGFFPCVEDFIGEGGSFENPRAISDTNIYPFTEGSKLDGYEALGGIQFESVTLLPKQEKTYIIAMGYGTSASELEDLSAKFFSEEVYKDSLQTTKKYWEDKINITYKSGSNDFDAWMHWVNFQPILRRIYGCSFLPHHDYGKGGRGWRDLWQDCLALLMMNPEGVKNMLLDNFAGVRMDGTNATIIGSKQGEFIADRNNIPRVWMDHGVWPFITTNLYIMQSGDIEILLEENYYFKDQQAVRGEEKDDKWQVKDDNHLKTSEGLAYKGNIIEHLLVQHLTAFYDVGEHNHIRLHNADWNDGLDMAKERGESVAFTSTYGGNLEQMAELLLMLDQKGIKTISLAEEIGLLLVDDASVFADISKKQTLLLQYCQLCKYSVTGKQIELSCVELATNLRNKASWIKEHIRSTEWIQNSEGHSWYNGYYDNSGKRVEGDNELGTRMMLTGQVFTIMSGTATKEQVKDIISAADAYLYEESMGGYKLNTNFNEVKTDLGRMFGFAYGHKENGAVFSHMAVMYANALYQRGFAKEGYRVINSLYGHSINFEASKIYPGIAEYINDSGRGMYHYLTGSASWLLLTVLTQMYGVSGSFGHLHLEPKLMLEQFDSNHIASVELIFANRSISVVYTNKDSKEYGDYEIASISIDGSLYEYEVGTQLIQRKDMEALDSNTTHCIQVELK